MESWRQVWRDGFAKVLPLAGLVALRDALANDDKRLVQGVTTVPRPYSQEANDCPAEAACAIGFCGWQSERLSTARDVGRFFIDACRECGWLLLDEETDFGNFLGWFDRTPRDEMRRELLSEVELAITSRTGARP